MIHSFLVGIHPAVLWFKIVFFSIFAVVEFVTGIMAVFTGRARLLHHVVYRADKPLEFWFLIPMKVFVLPPMFVMIAGLSMLAVALGK